MPTTDKQAKPAAGANVPAKTPATAREAWEALTHAQRLALINKAQHGDMTAWSAVQVGLEKIPHWEREYPTPAAYARRALLEAVTGGNPMVTEAWERQVCTMITELAGPDPSPLERILCERVATCWLDMSLAEAVFAAKTKGSISLAAGEYFDKLRDRAHKRYLSACVALAKVRRLLAPVAQQINIAQPGAAQLNVAAPAKPAVRQESLPATVDAAEADR